MNWGLIILRVLLCTVGAYFLAKVFSTKIKIGFLNSFVSIYLTKFCSSLISLVVSMMKNTSGVYLGRNILNYLITSIPVVGQIKNLISIASIVKQHANISQQSVMQSVYLNIFYLVLDIVMIVVIIKKFSTNESKPKIIPAKYACPKCGLPVTEDSKFCTNCGAKLV